MSQFKALKVSNISKSYGNKTILSNISLEIEEGDFVGLIGLNGAGKTTLLSSIVGLVIPDQGSIEINGYDRKYYPYQASLSIGFMPQEINFNNNTIVNDLLVLNAGLYGLTEEEGIRRINEILPRLFLEEKKYSEISELSGGMKRRLMMARALLMSPTLLILDEPTTGVDIQLRKKIWQYINEIHQKGTTIILTSHSIEEIDYLCKSVCLLSKGSISPVLPQSQMSQLLKVETHESILVVLEEEYNDLYLLKTEFPNIDFKKIDNNSIQFFYSSFSDIVYFFEKRAKCKIREIKRPETLELIIDGNKS
jgi:ABC-2 type transport system ATP-binding protein